MIRLEIERSSLALPDLVIDDSGTGTYVLMPGLSLGSRAPQVTFAESAWLDGGFPTSVRYPMTDIQAVVRVGGDDRAAAIDALVDAVAQIEFTLTATENAVPTAYSCCAGEARRLFNRFEMRAGRDLVALAIPRQP